MLSKTNPKANGMTTVLPQPPFDAPQASNAPIGLFDSGVGGLSVYMHLKDKLPNERYVYYADTQNVPYGSRSSNEITKLTLTAINWLVEVGCKLIVIACNSASAHALEVARLKHPHISIVGLVPALKPAVQGSKSGNVAVLATQATLNGLLLNDVIKNYAIPAKVNVIKQFNPNLVPWVESGMRQDCATARQLSTQLHHFANQNVDHLVLGCTHYPFFRKFVELEVQNHDLGITVIDSGAAIADRVKQLLIAKNQLALPTLNQSVIKDLSVDILSSDKALKQSIAPIKSRLSFFTTHQNSDLTATYDLVKRLVG